MKTIILFILLFISHSLFSQMSYFTGIGPMASKAINEHTGGVNPNINDYFVVGGIKFPIKKRLNFSFQSELNRSTLEIYMIDSGSYISYLRIRNNYLRIAPIIEFKPLRFIGFSAGLYSGLRIAERAKNDSIHPNTVLLSNEKFTKPFDFGYSFGSDVYFSKIFSAGINFVNGVENLIKLGIVDLNGNSIEDPFFKLSNVQLIFKFHLPD